MILQATPLDNPSPAPAAVQLGMAWPLVASKPPRQCKVAAVLGKALEMLVVLDLRKFDARKNSKHILPNGDFSW